MQIHPLRAAAVALPLVALSIEPLIFPPYFEARSLDPLAPAHPPRSALPLPVPSRNEERAEERGRGRPRLTAAG